MYAGISRRISFISVLSIPCAFLRNLYSRCLCKADLAYFLCLSRSLLRNASPSLAFFRSLYNRCLWAWDFALCNQAQEHVITTSLLFVLIWVRSLATYQRENTTTMGICQTYVYLTINYKTLRKYTYSTYIHLSFHFVSTTSPIFKM